MSSRKTTIQVEDELLDQLDIVADAMEISRNKLIIDLMQACVDQNLAKALVIKNKKEELAQLKAGF